MAFKICGVHISALRVIWACTALAMVHTFQAVVHRRLLPTLNITLLGVLSLQHVVTGSVKRELLSDRVRWSRQVRRLINIIIDLLRQCSAVQVVLSLILASQAVTRLFMYTILDDWGTMDSAMRTNLRTIYLAKVCLIVTFVPYLLEAVEEEHSHEDSA